MNASRFLLGTLLMAATVPGPISVPRGLKVPLPDDSKKVEPLNE